MTLAELDPMNTFSVVFSEYFIRYWVAAGGVYLLVNLALAARLAGRKLRGTALPKGQILREILSSLRTILVFAVTGFFVVWGAQYGVFRLYLQVPDYGWAYLAASLVALVLLHDAWFYWTHRLIHYPPLFRRVHRLHHLSNQTTPFTAFAFNVGEAVVNALFVPVVLLVLPLHPLNLLIFGWHQMVRNAVGHSGYELFPARKDGRPVFDWITTVTHHDLHHANARWNMGLYFTWWDRWMGTEHPEYLARFKAAARPDGPKVAAAKSA